MGRGVPLDLIEARAAGEARRRKRKIVDCMVDPGGDLPRRFGRIEKREGLAEMLKRAAVQLLLRAFKNIGRSLVEVQIHV